MSSAGPVKAIEKMRRLRVKRLSESATVPQRATSCSAGYDLHSAEAKVVAAGGNHLFKTSIAVEIPEGHYGRVAPRSGLAYRQQINVLGGVIDADYRGEIKIILINHSYEPFTVEQGDRIAQLILEKCSTPEVEEVEELSETVRGESGLGSTGVQSNSPSERAEPSATVVDAV